MPSRLGLVRRLGLLAIFVVSLVAFDRLLAAGFARTRVSPTQQSQLNQKLAEARQAGPYDVLVLGTSRAFEAIHPRDISERTGARVFKEAFQGKAPRYYYEFYRRYRRIVGKPKVAVYAVDYFLFDIKSERWTPDVAEGSPTSAVPQAPRSRGLHWPLLLVEDKQANDRAIVRMLQDWQEQVAPQHEPNPERYPADMDAYRGNTMARSGDPAVPEPAQYTRNPFRRFPGEEGEYFVRLLEDLERDGVEVLLVGLPDFIATYRTNIEQAQFAEIFSRLAASRRNCVFVNYNDPARFPLSNPSYFIDGKYGNGNSHLSKDGVAALLPLFLPDLQDALARAGSRR